MMKPEASNLEVVRSVMNAYNHLIELDVNGLKQFYRPRGWRQLEQAQK